MSSLDLDVWFAGFDHAVQAPFFAAVTDHAARVDHGASAGLIMESTPGHQRRSLLVEYLRTTMAAVLSGPDEVRADAEFTDVGLDSLMAVELRDRIRADLGVSLGVNAIWSHPSCDRLAGHLDTVLHQEI